MSEREVGFSFCFDAPAGHVPAGVFLWFDDLMPYPARKAFSRHTIRSIQLDDCLTVETGGGSQSSFFPAPCNFIVFRRQCFEPGKGF